MEFILTNEEKKHNLYWGFRYLVQILIWQTQEVHGLGQWTEDYMFTGSCKYKKTVLKHFQSNMSVCINKFVESDLLVLQVALIYKYEALQFLNTCCNIIIDIILWFVVI